MKSKKPIDLKRFLIPILRKSSLRWPARSEALKQARKDRGLYECATCKEQFGKKEVHVDHIDPVIAISGFTTWDSYITKLFGMPDQYQILCVSCHRGISLSENNLRAIKKKLAK